MKQPKFRHELKHFISLSDYYMIRQRLMAVARVDEYARNNGKYKVRSLYFDNLYDKVLMEKINGINNREKFRIRYYNDDTSFIKLEKKKKTNNLCIKESVLVTRGECEKILNGDLSWMKESDKPLLLELYAKMYMQLLTPRTLVDYTREAYVFKPGNVRITIDSDIKSGLYSQDLFNLKLPAINTGNPNQIMLEVKFDEFLPGIINDIIQVANRQASAFSKYAACRLLLT